MINFLSGVGAAVVNCFVLSFFLILTSSLFFEDSLQITMSGLLKKRKTVEDGEEVEELEEVEGGSRLKEPTVVSRVVVENFNVGDTSNHIGGSAGVVSLNQPTFNLFGHVHGGTLGASETKDVKDVKATSEVEATKHRNWMGKHVTIGSAKTKTRVVAKVIGVIRDGDETKWKLEVVCYKNKTVILSESELEEAIMRNDTGKHPLVVDVFTRPRGQPRKNRSPNTRKSF